ncbi:conserved hypothetical protein [Cenarchaeum symbiosum A]|uniref:Uncharacterized protein n=1 Tax=Cenarchaeum symbiosum (strain A) TaxID=414004 RepID=A0RTR9_CENSY|nr:conserved hypothetical protein [Cenarchaeum symbiosum A]
MEIVYEPWKKVIIRELVEYKFEDWIQQIAFATKTSGGGIATVNWAKGVVFSVAIFPPTEAVTEENMKGILYLSSVTFAIKEKFEKQVVYEGATISLIDVGANETFNKLSDVLRARTKY